MHATNVCFFTFKNVAGGGAHRSESTPILDVRFWCDCKLRKGLPNSHEIRVLSFGKYLHGVLREKNVLIVCQTGYNAPSVAYVLRRRRPCKVSFLLTGLAGWWVVWRDLYTQPAGKNISKLQR